MNAKLCWIVILAVLFTLFSSPGFAKEPEEIWEELSKLKGEKRLNFLISKARAEGEVIWYSNINTIISAPLREGFRRRFPGVELKYWRGSGEAVANRVMTEARAGRFEPDVIGAANEFIHTLLNGNLLGRYKSPERKFYPEDLKDREGYWTLHTTAIAVMAYNTNLVPKSQAPTKYEDFLNPKWKGNFAIDTNSDRTVMGWLKTWGTEKTEKFLEGIIKNDVAVRRGHTLITQLLCAGEFKAAIELYAYRVAELKHKGCPIKIIFPKPTVGAGTPLVISKRSPHPYAAALLVDYILSEIGQKSLASKGRQSPRPGIRPKYPEIDVEKNGGSLLYLRPDDAEKFGKQYFELRERFLLNR